MPTLTCRRILTGLAAGAMTASLGAGVASAAPPNGVPFAASSPFNQLVPSGAPIAGNTGNFNSSLGMSYAEYTPAVYTSDAADPLVTIRLTAGWSANPLNGLKIHVDSRARPSAESDAHVTIVDTSQDLVVSLYQAKPISGGVLTATWGGMAKLSGIGSNNANSSGGRESGISQLAGLITPDDVRRAIAAGENGDLGHALALMHSSISNRSFVSPAISAGGNTSDPNALLMGQRVFLESSVNVAALPCEGDAKGQRFCRIIARTLQRYGAIAVTNSSNTTGFQMVNPLSWTAVGQANPWPDLVGADRAGYYAYAVRAIPWQRLHPMAGQGTPGPTQPGVTAPPRTPSPTPTPTPRPAPAPTPALVPRPPSVGGGGEVLFPATAPASPVTTEAGVTIRRRIQVVRGTVYARLVLTSDSKVTVRARLRVLRPGTTLVRRRAVWLRKLTPGTPRVLRMKLSAAGGGSGDLGVWIRRPGPDTPVLLTPVTLR